jgi:hypothetical protein
VAGRRFDLVFSDGGTFSGRASLQLAGTSRFVLSDGGPDLSSVLGFPGTSRARLANDAGAVLDFLGATEVFATSRETGTLGCAAGRRLQPAPAPRHPGVGQRRRGQHRGHGVDLPLCAG